MGRGHQTEAGPGHHFGLIGPCAFPPKNIGRRPRKTRLTSKIRVFRVSIGIKRGENTGAPRDDGEKERIALFHAPRLSSLMFLFYRADLGKTYPYLDSKMWSSRGTSVYDSGLRLKVCHGLRWTTPDIKSLYTADHAKLWSGSDCGIDFSITVCAMVDTVALVVHRRPYFSMYCDSSVYRWLETQG